MDIDFDPVKRDATLLQRGPGFARSVGVFAAPLTTFKDERANYGELRRIRIGYLDDRMIVVVWTQRGDCRRTISMRKANDREQARYRGRR
ncbi:BrnT family toxin [uncultured Methylobacterium sp.]|uniref:BrnT family toxin n=1 Tax=uncultured Methylobacterium sp. TaxID=157278 RepID=UPI0035CBDBDE